MVKLKHHEITDIVTVKIESTKKNCLNQIRIKKEVKDSLAVDRLNFTTFTMFVGDLDRNRSNEDVPTIY